MIGSSGGGTVSQSATGTTPPLWYYHSRGSDTTTTTTATTIPSHTTMTDTGNTSSSTVTATNTISNHNTTVPPSRVMEEDDSSERRAAGVAESSGERMENSTKSNVCGGDSSSGSAISSGLQHRDPHGGHGDRKAPPSSSFSPSSSHTNNNNNNNNTNASTDVTTNINSSTYLTSNSACEKAQSSPSPGTTSGAVQGGTTEMKTNNVNKKDDCAKGDVPENASSSCTNSANNNLTDNNVNSKQRGEGVGGEGEGGNSTRIATSSTAFSNSNESESINTMNSSSNHAHSGGGGEGLARNAAAMIAIHQLPTGASSSSDQNELVAIGPQPSKPNNCDKPPAEITFSSGFQDAFDSADHHLGGSSRKQQPQSLDHPPPTTTTVLTSVVEEVVMDVFTVFPRAMATTIAKAALVKREKEEKKIAEAAEEEKRELRARNRKAVGEESSSSSGLNQEHAVPLTEQTKHEYKKEGRPKDDNNNNNSKACSIDSSDESDPLFALKIVMLTDQHSTEDKHRMMNEPRCLLRCKDFFAILGCHDHFTWSEPSSSSSVSKSKSRKKIRGGGESKLEKHEGVKSSEQNKGPEMPSFFRKQTEEDGDAKRGNTNNDFLLDDHHKCANKCIAATAVEPDPSPAITMGKTEPTPKQAQDLSDVDDKSVDDEEDDANDKDWGGGERDEENGETTADKRKKRKNVNHSDLNNTQQAKNSREPQLLDKKDAVPSEVLPPLPSNIIKQLGLQAPRTSRSMMSKKSSNIISHSEQRRSEEQFEGGDKNSVSGRGGGEREREGSQPQQQQPMLPPPLVPGQRQKGKGSVNNALSSKKDKTTSRSAELKPDEDNNENTNKNRAPFESDEADPNEGQAKQHHQEEELPSMIGLILDLAATGDLRKAIRQRRASNYPFLEHEAGIMFIQILFAVHHCHAMGIIHRDIKTANVFVMEDGTLKLGDFGYSRCYFRPRSELEKYKDTTTNTKEADGEKEQKVGEEKKGGNRCTEEDRSRLNKKSRPNNKDGESEDVLLVTGTHTDLAAASVLVNPQVFGRGEGTPSQHTRRSGAKSGNTNLEVPLPPPLPLAASIPDSLTDTSKETPHIATAKVFINEDTGDDLSFVEINTRLGRTLCGTPNYTAPELLRRRTYSKKIDLYSLGVILYELLTLRRPYEESVNTCHNMFTKLSQRRQAERKILAASPANVLTPMQREQIVQREAVEDQQLHRHQRSLMERMASNSFDPLPPHITPEMRNLVASLLHFDPEKRPSTEELLYGNSFVRLLVDGFIAVTQIRSEYRKTRSLISSNIQMVRFAVGTLSGASCGAGGPACTPLILRERYNYARRLCLEKAKEKFKRRWERSAAAAAHPPIPIKDKTNDNDSNTNNLADVDARRSYSPPSLKIKSRPHAHDPYHKAHDKSRSTLEREDELVEAKTGKAISKCSIPPFPLPSTVITAIASPLPTQQVHDDRVLRNIATDPRNLIIDGEVLKIESDGTATKRYLCISAVVDIEAGNEHLKAIDVQYLAQLKIFEEFVARARREWEERCRSIGRVSDGYSIFNNNNRRDEVLTSTGPLQPFQLPTPPAHPYGGLSQLTIERIAREGNIIHGHQFLPPSQQQQIAALAAAAQNMSSGTSPATNGGGKSKHPPSGSSLHPQNNTSGNMMDNRSCQSASAHNRSSPAPPKPVFLHSSSCVLTIADSRRNLRDKCLVIPFTNLADAFPIPPSYVGIGIGGTLSPQHTTNVFDIAFRNGKFRLRIQAESPEDRDRWVTAVQTIVALTTAHYYKYKTDGGDNKIKKASEKQI